MAKVIMVQGTMSNAGKSLLVAGLCRIFKQDGFSAAPFKSQNMALNSYITDDGLEMGRAQVMQAEAAGIAPETAMNPILLKPVSSMGSQLIVNGIVRGNYPAVEYFKMKRSLIPDILSAYNHLAERFDILVVEGAGSPAEINLRENDIVNMGLAELIDAPVLLAGDIDRGGVFAQLFGTAALLKKEERERIRAFIINKFRGDKEILKPGLSMLYERCPIPVAGVVPYMDIDIDDEDSLSERLNAGKNGASDKEGRAAFARIAIIKLPRISNFTDFNVLERLPGISVRYVTRPGDLKDADMILLPGTKNTMGDLKWLRASGLEAMILRRYAEGAFVFGVCGGYQMLGEALKDPYQVEEGGSMSGIGLLPVKTVFAQDKTRTRVEGSTDHFGGKDAKLFGYEIHMGETVRFGGKPFSKIKEVVGTHLPKEDGCVYDHAAGTYIHGVFDSEELLRSLWQFLASEKKVGRSWEEEQNTDSFSLKAYKEAQYDKLADCLRNNLDMKLIYRILNREDRGRS